MRRLFIVNPSALRDKVSSVVDSIKKHFGEDSVIKITEKGGDAESIAYSESPDEIYAVGGDGTVCEVANGLGKKLVDNDFAKGVLPTFAVIPAGSGNDFARSEYGTELSTEAAIKGLSSGKYPKQPFDMGKVVSDGENKFFVNIASVGFDAEIVKNADRYKKNPITRRFSYMLSILYTVFKFKGVEVEIECEGRTISERMLLMAVANGSWYGGGIKIAPTADMNDGLFDVIFIPMLKPLKVVFLLPTLLNGSHIKQKVVTLVRAKSVKVNSKQGDILLNLDGELSFTRSADFDILTSAMELYAKENL